MRPFLIVSLAVLALAPPAIGQGVPQPQQPAAPPRARVALPAGGAGLDGITIAFESQGKHVTVMVRGGMVTVMADNKLVWSGRPATSPTTVDQDGKTLAWLYPQGAQLGTRAQLGINVGPLDAALAEHVGLERNGAVIVLGTTKDGPADKAGVRKFDIVTQLDGASPVTQKSLSEAIGAKKPGDKMALRLLRKGEAIQIEVTLGTESSLTPLSGYGSIITAARDGTLRYWDAQTGQVQQPPPLRGATPPTGGLFVTPDPTLKSDLERLRKDIERMEKVLEELRKQRESR